MKKERSIRVLLNEKQIEDLFEGIGEAHQENVNEPIAQIIVNETGGIKLMAIIGEHTVVQEYNEVIYENK